jgi:hypothetical protein
MARPLRPRRQRREQERALRAAVKRVERLAEELPGGTPERPIEVASSSVIEPQARATRCPQCASELEIRADRAESTPRGVLRAIDVICRRCHAPRTLWFRIAAPGLN